MTKKRVRRRPIKSSLNLGGLAAESDHLLSQAYYDNGDYETISSTLERRCFVIGRTGSGKSAAFAHLQQEKPNQVISIIPENLSLPYLTNLDVVHHLLELDVHLEPFLVALWKHVILVEVIKHRYRVTSPEAKQNFLRQLRERLATDHAKVLALKYLDEFGDKFWCEADERVKQIAESFVEKVSRSGDVGVGVNGASGKFGAGKEQTYSQEQRSELAARYQRIVNEAQLPRLNDMIVILNDEILDSSQHFTYLLIDDLDKEWVDDRLMNTLIRCLFQAVIDMLRVRNLKILVALRTNIFRQLDYGARSQGGQEEKFRGMAINLKWTESDLRALLEQRAEAASNFYHLEESLSLGRLLPNSNRTRGDAATYILDRTLMRPRDAILYMNACLREAAGKPVISWEDIRKAEPEYSRERLDALRDEWKNPYPGIERVLECFMGKSANMSSEELLPILDDAVLALLADESFQGKAWLSEMVGNVWDKNSDPATWDKMYRCVISLLFEVSFLGFVRRPNDDAIYSYQGSPPILDEQLLQTHSFEIHPAFRRGLQIREPAPART